ncbi:hypothetical protein BMW23_0702 [Bodo saltans virus]|uniref:WLM domain-containing protein n=1 Tax=Bodo saltans virus TaxID=2024608 RepID=A0A2H4UUZ9_9VIRU|nr:hypothetical protein QJ851_gp0685 [Bodo saltans virus]ATZ80748.1 hypothetical protein BMW23_0702 [Bodo saltans virus]
MTYVKSDVDNNMYLVRNTDDKNEAANMLALIMANIIKLSDNVFENIDKYPEYTEYINLLHKKAKYIVLLESTQNNVYTSYSVNKGEKIVFCLRTKTTGDKLHDLNLIMYVVLHELAHVACPIYDNHGPLFMKIFKFLTQRAIELNLYQKIEFDKKPEKYCGMDITSSII